jgi:hypothetical protein
MTTRLEARVDMIAEAFDIENEKMVVKFAHERQAAYLDYLGLLDAETLRRLVEIVEKEASALTNEEAAILEQFSKGYEEFVLTSDSNAIRLRWGDDLAEPEPDPEPPTLADELRTLSSIQAEYFSGPPAPVRRHFVFTPAWLEWRRSDPSASLVEFRNHKAMPPKLEIDEPFIRIAPLRKPRSSELSCIDEHPDEEADSIFTYKY